MPALGSPTRPTSAMSLSTSSICRSWPSSPGSHSRGAWCVEVAKRALPRPPRPPRATSRRVAGLEHLAEQLAGVGVPHDRAGRHREVDVVGGGAGLGLPLAVLAALRLPHGAIPVVEQRGEVGVAPHVDAAAVAAVAAVRPALGLVLEAGERAGPRPAGAGRHPHDRAIDEHQLPGDHPSRTVRQSSLIFFHWSNESSGLTIESTPSIWPNDAPALSAPAQVRVQLLRRLEHGRLGHGAELAPHEVEPGPAERAAVPLRDHPGVDGRMQRHARCRGACGSSRRTPCRRPPRPAGSTRRPAP